MGQPRLPCPAFFASNIGNSAEGSSVRGGNASLHSHLNRLEWTECNIRNKFSGSTGGQVHGSLPARGPFFSDKVAVELLEVFITTVFECTLGLRKDISTFSVILLLSKA